MYKTVHRISAGTAGGGPVRSVAAEPPAIEPHAVRRVESATLFQLDREVVITRRGQEYRLRITKSDKLILTK